MQVTNASLSHWRWSRHGLWAATAIAAAALLITGLVVGPLAKAKAATSPVTVFVSRSTTPTPTSCRPSRPCMHLACTARSTRWTAGSTSPSYLTLAQVQQIQADGNEIARAHGPAPGPADAAAGRAGAGDLPGPGEPDQPGASSRPTSPTRSRTPTPTRRTRRPAATTAPAVWVMLSTRRVTATAASTPRRRRRRTRTTCGPRTRSTRPGRWRNMEAEVTNAAATWRRLGHPHLPPHLHRYRSGELPRPTSRPRRPSSTPS